MATHTPEVQATEKQEPRAGRTGRLGADYAVLGVLVVLVAIFAIGMSSKFSTSSNIDSLLSQNAIPGILALAVLFPLAAGEFDLSVAATLGFCSVLSAYLAGHGYSVPVICVMTLATGVVIGLANSVLVVGIGLNSFIATLGTSTLLAAGNLLVTNGSTLYQGINGSFSGIATTSIFGGVQIVILYFVVIALVIWYLLERTPYGRYLRATGLGRAAAGLSGIRTGRYLFGSFVIAGALAGLCGLLETAQFGSAQESVGPSFLLPAYAAAFLGATTVKRGMFNVWGTVIAVALLAVGINGLTLAGAATWVTDAFDGAALLVAVSIAVFVARRQETAGLRTKGRRQRRGPAGRAGRGRP